MINLQRRVIFFIIFVVSSTAAFVAPFWNVDPTIQTGQMRLIIQTMSSVPVYYDQAFLTSLQNPKILIALIGLEQGVGADVGFRTTIISSNSNSFRVYLQVYGPRMRHLSYMFMAVQQQNLNYRPVSKSEIFSGQLRTNQTRTIVKYTEPGQLYHYWQSDRYRTCIFLTGYRMDSRTLGVNIQLSLKLLSPQSYNVIVKTKPNTNLTQVHYSRLIFNYQQITQSQYVFVDLGSVYGSISRTFVEGDIVNQGFQYRNFITGINKIKNSAPNSMNILVNVSTTITQIDNIFDVASPSFPSYISAGSETQLSSQVFIQRNAQCPPSMPYFQPNNSLCYDVCPQDYYISGQLCKHKPICGDGNKQNINNIWVEQCDDGNTQSYDGCSSQCKVECDYNCYDVYLTQNQSRILSNCTYFGYWSERLISVTRIIDANRFAVVLRTLTGKGWNNNCEENQGLKERLSKLKHIKLKESKYQTGSRLLAEETQLAVAESGHRYFYEAYSTSNIFHIVFDYNQSIPSLKNKYLQVFPNSQKTNIILKQPFNGLRLNYYNPIEYQKLKSIPYILLIIIGINMAYLLIMIAFKKSAIAIQGILVVQFAYFCIAGQSQVQLSFAFWSMFGNFNTGLAINFFKGLLPQYVVCPQTSKIWLDCNSYVTFGVTGMLASVLMFVIMGSLIHRYRKTKNSQDEDTLANMSRVENYFQPNNSVIDKQSGVKEKQQIQNKSTTAPSTKESSRNERQLTYFSSTYSMFLSFCLEFTMSVFFLTAISFFFVARNQSFFGFELSSMIWVSFYGMFNVTFWVVWFCFYPFQGLSCSYVNIVRLTKERCSIYKFYYPILYYFLNAFGILITFAPASATYSALALWCIFYSVLIHYKNIYVSKINKIRSMANQLLILSLVPIFIILEYVENDGIASLYMYIVSAIVTVSTLWNIIMGVYYICDQKNNDRYAKDSEKQAVQQIAVELKNFATVGRAAQERQTEFTSISVNKDRNKYGLKQFEAVNPRRQLLVQFTQNKENIKSKTNDLRNFKKEMKIKRDKSENNEVRVQFYNTLHRANDEDEIVDY